MAHVHEPIFYLRPDGSRSGQPLQGITYQQALDSAKDLAKVLNKRVYVEAITTLASADPYDIAAGT